MDVYDKIGGPFHVIAILKSIPIGLRTQLLQELRRDAPYIITIYDHCIFLYSDIGSLDDLSIQELLKTIPTESWLIAFKLTNSPLRTLILENMSKTRRKLFMEEFKTQPKMPRSQVCKMQMHIADSAREMLEAGKIRFKAKKVPR